MSTARSEEAPAPDGEATEKTDQYLEFVDQIKAREAARAAKNWPEADRIRGELRAAGVNVLDKQKTWSTPDGRRWPMSEEQEPRRSTALSVPLEEIQELIRQREQAREAKDWGEGDRLRDAIRARGVHLYDKEKVWRAANGTFGIIPSWDANRAHTLQEAAIYLLLKERELARQAKDWAKGDQIRDLLREHGVQLFDRDRAWRATDGRTGYIANVQQQQVLAQQQRQLQQLQQQVLLGQAAGIGAQGGAAVGSSRAGLDPNNPHMFGAPGAFALARVPMVMDMGGMGGMGGAMVALGAMPAMGGAAVPGLGAAAVDYGTANIEYLVQQRETARQLRDYKQADALREALRGMGVTLYDREKRWTSRNGKQGVIPAYQPRDNAGGY